MFLSREHESMNSLNVPLATQTLKDELKLVFVGNVGSGKTTALEVISEKAVIGTEAKATEQDALHRKNYTTVAMEYGAMQWNNTKLHLYGTPGQRRFDFMIPIVCKGAAGLVLMIDNGHAQPLVELDYFLKAHGEFLQQLPAIIAITHYDDNNTDTHLVEYHQYLSQQGFKVPVMRVDAREKAQVQQLVQRLLAEINHR
jgi:signal recognition particle receptor subunit beta